MAKSPAPFMSINPSGSIAGLLTASRWKGIPYLRLLVTPSNPRTSGQVATRLIFGSLSRACVAVLTSFKDTMHVGSPFFTEARDGAPSGQSWKSWVGQVGYNAASAQHTAWTGETGTVKGYFQTTAEAIGLYDYTPSFTGDPGYVAGEQLYALAFFASANLPDPVKSIADTALVGASQGDVDDFGDAVHLTT